MKPKVDSEEDFVSWIVGTVANLEDQDVKAILIPAAPAQPAPSTSTPQQQKVVCLKSEGHSDYTIRQTSLKGKALKIRT